MIAETINDHRDMISSASLMVVLSMVIREAVIYVLAEFVR